MGTLTRGKNPGCWFPCSDATASVPMSCSKSQHPVRDTDTKMIDAQWCRMLHRFGNQSTMLLALVVMQIIILHNDLMVQKVIYK